MLLVNEQINNFSSLSILYPEALSSIKDHFYGKRQHSY